MLCLRCGKENAHAFGYCDNCGAALTPVPGQSTGFPVGPVQPVKTMSPAGWLAIAACAAFAVFVTFTWPVRPRMMAGAFRLGILIGTMLPPLVVAYLAGGIRKWRNPNRFAAVFCAVGMVWTGLAWVGSQNPHETDDQRIGRLMREAAGVQPVRNAFFASDRKFDDAFRETFRNVIALNHEYSPRLKNLDQKEISKVGSLQSFTDPDYAVEGLKQVHTSNELNQEIEQRLTAIAANMRHTIEGPDWPSSSRAEALAGFERGFTNVMEKRNRVLDKERAYIGTADGLYAYANTHHSEIILDHGRLRIDNASVREDFNSKIREYNARRQDLLQARKEFEQWQAGLFQKMSLNAKDIGLP